MLKLKRHIRNLGSLRIFQGLSEKHSITKQHIPQYLSNKHKGWAFIFGVFTIVFVITLGAILFQKQKIDLAVTTVEDTLTASGLAVLNVDTQALSLRGDLVLSDNNKNNDASSEYSNINDVTAMYEEVLNLTAKNLGMENASQTSTYMANISTSNKLYNTNLYPACVKKVIFYDYVEGNIRRYTFTSLSSPKITHEIGSVSKLKEVPIMDYTVTVDKPNEENVKTPTNVEVATDTVSVYIEFQFPVKIMGIEQYVTKGIYVKLDLS